MFRVRLGIFLLIIGVVLLIAFFGTDQQRNPLFTLFCGGALCIASAFYLIWRNYQAPPRTSDRFRTVRRVSRRYKDWRVVQQEKSAQKKKK